MFFRPNNRIDFPGDVSTKTADIVTVKVLLNSVMSTPAARFMTADRKDFNLGTIMDLFHYANEACLIRTSLEALGHPQPQMQTDNSTATSIANDTVKQKRSKAIEMRFFWVQDRVRQKHFHIFWQKGSLSRADYFTKHHPASHHQKVRPFYLHTNESHNDNYFKCLADDDEAPILDTVDNKQLSSVSVADDVAGEGVLIPGSPDP